MFQIYWQANCPVEARAVGRRSRFDDCDGLVPSVATAAPRIEPTAPAAGFWLSDMTFIPWICLYVTWEK